MTATKEKNKHAIIETGSKQYFVTEGTIIDIEKIEDEPKKEISFDKILLVSENNKTTIGKPYVEKSTVQGTILEQLKDDKVIVFKFKKKTGYKKKQGHRQKLTRILINKITHSTTTTKKTETETETKTETKTENKD